LQRNQSILEGKNLSQTNEKSDREMLAIALYCDHKSLQEHFLNLYLLFTLK